MSGTTYRRSSFALPKPSGFNKTREKERFELSTLNDKFADYVEKVRYLEAQNRKIQMDANYLTEKQLENCQKVKTLFEQEISQLKEIAESLFKEKNIAFAKSQEVQVRHQNFSFCLFFLENLFSEYDSTIKTTFISNIQRIRYFEIRN